MQNNSRQITLQDLIRFEANDSVQVKHIFIDICDGDLNTGIILSQIFYWFGCNPKTGEKRCRHLYNGRLCLIKQRDDWWRECRIHEKTAYRSISKLKELGILDTEVHKSPFHNGNTASFIFLNEVRLLELILQHLDKLKEDEYLNEESSKNLSTLDSESGPPWPPSPNPIYTETYTDTYKTTTTGIPKKDVVVVFYKCLDEFELSDEAKREICLNASESEVIQHIEHIKNKPKIKNPSGQLLIAVRERYKYPEATKTNIMLAKEYNEKLRKIHPKIAKENDKLLPSAIIILSIEGKMQYSLNENAYQKNELERIIKSSLEFLEHE